MQNYKYILLLGLYLKEYTDLIKHDIKCSPGNGWDGIEQLRWSMMRIEQHFQNKQTPNKVKNETSLLSHLSGHQEGMKSQEANSKHLSLGL